MRAPALIAFVKDTLIYLTVIVAIIYIPTRIGGGWSHIFSAAQTRLTTPNPTTKKPAARRCWAPAALPFATLAIGSAMALFMYPHAQVGVLATKSRNTMRRNLSALTAYSLMLGLIALLGYMAIAAGIHHQEPGRQRAARRARAVQRAFPSWFAGVAFSAVAIGALVPAAIMSIAAANLFTRNVWMEFVRPNASPQEQTQVSQIASLLVKFGALAFVLSLDATSAINFQLLGGVLILQTFPAIVFGLYTRYFHRWALLLGWASGIVYGTVVAPPTAWPSPGNRTRTSAGRPRQFSATPCASRSPPPWSSTSSCRRCSPWCSGWPGCPTAPARRRPAQYEDAAPAPAATAQEGVYGDWLPLTPGRAQ